MVDTSKMMFARPIHCRYCGHGYYGLGHVVDYANQIGKWTIIDMEKEQSVKAPICAAIDQHDPASYDGFGHGNNTVYTGDTEQPIFTSTDCDKLAGRIVYLLSCLTANGLGPAIIAAGGKSYAGFNISWTWMSDSGTAGDPYDDIYAKGFYESSNEYWVALIDGYNFGDACQRSIDKYNEWIDYWIYENPGASGAASAITWLAHDRDGLVALGDLSAKLLECDEQTTKDDCLAHGCYWWEGSCHSELPPDIQDTKYITINVPPGTAYLENVLYPIEAYEDFSIEIKYDCRNLGGQNLIWGHIRNLDTDEIINGTYWEEIIPPNEIKSVSSIIPPITGDYLNLRIEVGH